MAANSYSNRKIYVKVKRGKTLPASCTTEIAEGTKYSLRPLGEGVNEGDLPDGEFWVKNCFYSIKQLRDLVHAEDAGDIEILEPAEMRALIREAQPAEIGRGG